MLQDDDNRLSRWLANRPGARYQVRMNMTEQQPTALRLADALTEKEYPPRRAAAAELRRLHSVNAQLLEALEEAVRLGATTQLLEPTPSTPEGGAMSRKRSQDATARSPASSFRLRYSAA